VHTSRFLLIACLASLLAACSTTPRNGGRSAHSALPIEALNRIADSSSHQKVGEPYTISGRRYVPQREDSYDEVGTGSWYGPNFHGRPTANGEIFDQNLLTAAHTTLPIPSVVEVTNLENGRSIIVRLNDRGPFVDDRIIDLSRAAATQLGYQSRGLAQVRVRYLGPAIAANADPYSGSRAPGIGAAPSRSSSVPLQAAAATSSAAALARPQYAAPSIPTRTAVNSLGANLPALPPADGATHPAPGTFDPSPLEANLPALPSGQMRPSVASPQSSSQSHPAPAMSGTLTVQVGAFSSEANARALTDRLSAAGEAWFDRRVGDNGVIYRVFFGRWSDNASASSARTLLENWDVFDAIIVDTP
jgi:rare lipoprotein A